MRPALIPAMRYENALAAIDFLCQAFGFERHVVYADETDSTLIHHAQLTLDGNMIMLGSARREGADLYGWKLPREAGGVTTSICVVLPDPDAHYARALANGADIIKPVQDNQGYPGRGYDTRDLEGHVWTFGSYDPWAT